MTEPDKCVKCGAHEVSPWDDLMTARRCGKCGWTEERGYPRIAWKLEERDAK